MAGSTPARVTSRKCSDAASRGIRSSAANALQRASRSAGAPGAPGAPHVLASAVGSTRPPRSIKRWHSSWHSVARRPRWPWACGPSELTTTTGPLRSFSHTQMASAETPRAGSSITLTPRAARKPSISNGCCGLNAVASRSQSASSYPSSNFSPDKRGHFFRHASSADASPAGDASTGANSARSARGERGWPTIRAAHASELTIHSSFDCSPKALSSFATELPVASSSSAWALQPVVARSWSNRDARSRPFQLATASTARGSARSVNLSQMEAPSPTSAS